jgi:hypothetical protein
MCHACTPDGDTETFEILAEVLQGDTLAPFLFIIVLVYALRKAISGREDELGSPYCHEKADVYQHSSSDHNRLRFCR